MQIITLFSSTTLILDKQNKAACYNPKMCHFNIVANWALPKLNIKIIRIVTEPVVDWPTVSQPFTTTQVNGHSVCQPLTTIQVNGHSGFLSSVPFQMSSHGWPQVHETHCPTTRFANPPKCTLTSPLVHPLILQLIWTVA